MTPHRSTTLRTFAPEDRGNWAAMVQLARAADIGGVDRLAISDHVAFGEHPDAYGDPSVGGTVGGSQPTGPDGAWLDPLATIAHLTAITSRVRFATSILIAALRRPVVLAKTAGTTDVLSGAGSTSESASGGSGRSTRPPACRSNVAVGCSITLSRSARPSGIISSPRTAVTSSPSTPSIRCHNRSGRTGCPSGSVAPSTGGRWTGWLGSVRPGSHGEPTRPTSKAASDECARPCPSECWAWDDLEVVGTLKSVRSPNRTLDLDRTFEPVPSLRAAGVTDFRLALAPPAGFDTAVAYFGEVTSAFRSAVR